MIQPKYLLLCSLAAGSAQAARAQEPDAAPVLPATPAQAPDPALEQARARVEAEQRRSEATERGTPQGTLDQFTQAVSFNDLMLAARCVEGGRASTDLKKLQARQEKMPRTLRLEETPLFGEAVPARAEFEARVAVSLRADGLMGDALQQSKITFIERVTMRRDGKEWKIVPRQAPPQRQAPRFESVPDKAQALEDAALAAQSEDDGLLNTWARTMVQPHAVLMRAVSQSSLMNIKQLGLGVLQLSQDYDEVLSFTTANFQDRVMPYVKSTQVFLAPTLDEGKAFAYAINPAIAGRSLASFDDPAHTVAIYEAGPDGQPLFRFGGKAAVGFMDGHAELVGPDDVPGLVEKPKPKSTKAS